MVQGEIHVDSEWQSCFAGNLLNLKSKQPFARGGGLLCYVHPQREVRCVKILRSGKAPSDLRRKDPFYKRLRSSTHYDQNLRDLKIYRGLSPRLKSDARRHLLFVDGLVRTDPGSGLCLELIRDVDGLISLSLK